MHYIIMYYDCIFFGPGCISTLSVCSVNKNLNAIKIFSEMCGGMLYQVNKITEVYDNY